MGCTAGSQVDVGVPAPRTGSSNRAFTGSPESSVSSQVSAGAYSAAQPVQVWSLPDGAWLNAKVGKVYPEGDLLVLFPCNPTLPSRIIPAGKIGEGVRAI